MGGNGISGRGMRVGLCMCVHACGQCVVLCVLVYMSDCLGTRLNANDTYGVL